MKTTASPTAIPRHRPGSFGLARSIPDATRGPMTEPSNARRYEEAERLPRCCQTWIVEQTRRRGRRDGAEAGQRDGPAPRPGRELSALRA